jgi:hypothetical protein
MMMTPQSAPCFAAAAAEAAPAKNLVGEREFTYENTYISESGVRPVPRPQAQIKSLEISSTD